MNDTPIISGEVGAGTYADMTAVETGAADRNPVCSYVGMEDYS